MGVPGFYSWLTRRYPLIKHMLDKKQIPKIDYLYLDMNGIIYKCVRDDSIIFKSQILPKELQEIWIEIFNYINMIVNLLKPAKMVFMALDGVAPRSKMNNQRARRFKSARDYKEYIESYYGYTENVDSQENFKNNSISPGTKFMHELNAMLKFFILKKIQQDQQWRNLSIIFTGSDTPGEGQHKIMEFLRSNQHQFQPQDNHCLYGADADLIMLGLTLPMKNILIIRQQFIHSDDKVSIVATRQQKKVQFQIIFLTLLKQYFQIQYSHLKQNMKMEFNIKNIINDFVFLFFFIGNDFLPRCMTYNIRRTSIEKLIVAFKNYLVQSQNYVVAENQIDMKALGCLTSQLSKYQRTFLEQKAQDAQKYLLQKSKFESQFLQEIKTKVRKQAQFLLQMKTLYQTQDGSQSKLFYQQKFNIDPSTHPEQFSKILIYYYYGLRFVHQYYFVNLPSWSWYYPYYYAPLISDLSYYIQFLSQNQYKNDPLQEGQPFQPFKQLMCILPKQSAELLPKPFQEQLLNHQSALRSPIDYYPDNFDSDMYGSTYEYQSISLIPFLDHEMIQHIYQRNITKISQQQLERNKFKETELFEYNANLEKQLQVQSPFPHIQSFKCNIEIKKVNLRKEFKWVHIHQLKISKSFQKLYRMPSLKIKQFEQIQIQSKRGVISYNMKILSPDITQVKMGSQVFYGYPLQHSGQIQAVLTKSQFKFTHKFYPIDYAFNQDMRKSLTIQAMKNNKQNMFYYVLDMLTSRDKYPYFDLGITETLFFISDTQCFVRTLGGKFVRSFQQNNNKSYQIVPGSFVSKQKFYQTTKDNVEFSSLEEQFTVGQQALILSDRKYIGAKCKVKGYNADKNRVKVTIQKQLKQMKNDAILAVANTDQVFFTLRFASQLVGLRPDILLTIIDSIHVSLPKQKNLPQAIDIGMNFISRHQNQLVPNLVRINYAKEEIQNIPEAKVFMKLQLSLRAIQLLVQYKKNYSDVFDFIKARHQRLIQQAKLQNKGINWKQSIQVEKLFKNQDAAVKALMKVYLWLIKKQETHMPLSSIYSKQISKKKIAKLQEMFKERTQQLKNKKNKKMYQSVDIDIDPNFLFSTRLASYGLIHLKQKPENHLIGDAVLCLKKQFFGEYGIIIGIDDQKYEVLFEKPSFGKTNLKGLCSNLWGGKFNFRDLFNLSQNWWKFIDHRRKAGKVTEQLGWLQSQQAFFPKFKSNPLKNFQDVQKLKKLIPQKLYQFMQQIKTKIKQVQLDPQYIVLDNKRQDYYYKYNRNQATVGDQQVRDIKKANKFIEKPVNPKQIMGQDAINNAKNFVPEVIENKVSVDQNQKTEQKKQLTANNNNDSIPKDKDKKPNYKPKVQEQNLSSKVGGNKKYKPKQQSVPIENKPTKYVQKEPVKPQEMKLEQAKKSENQTKEVLAQQQQEEGETAIQIGQQEQDADGIIG